MKNVDIQLTKSQKVLVPKMQAFLDGPDRIFLLTGKPGVGKTTMTKIMLAEHIEADRNSNSSFSMNVAGICLAHQAKNVLGEHIPNVFTFAKAFGLKEAFDEATGKRQFVYDKYNAGNVIGTRQIPVFVHDEVSQYTPEMLEIVFEKTPIFSKIIFIGDRAQLPPIDPDNKMEEDADSPIFYYDIPESCKHELDERVRQQAHNPILDLSDIIREQIFGDQNINIMLDAIQIPKMIDGIGFDHLPYRNLPAHIKSQPDIMEVRMIAFRNKTINAFNPMIRNYLLGNPDSILVEGDIVTMMDSYYKVNSMDIVEYVLFNSETFKVTKIYTSVIKYKAGTKTYSVDCYIANIHGKKGQFIIPTETGSVVLEDALSIIADRCRSKKLPWPTFWNFKKMFCKYSYGYASTAYKSQGSSYDTIYVDVNDVLLTGPLTPKRKLQTIYTAITRARKDVYFLKS